MALTRNPALGLYISVPFCRSKCTYCNFASGVYPASEHARYVGRVIEDLTNAEAWAAATGVELPRTVDTVYLGGGTPSLLAPELIAVLFGAMRNEFELAPDAEITVECAPGQIAPGTMEALAAAGVNRVSLGAQSFIDGEAASSGRLHKRETVLEDLRRLRTAGIANLNVDLIAGLARPFASFSTLATSAGSFPSRRWWISSIDPGPGGAARRPCRQINHHQKVALTLTFVIQIPPGFVAGFVNSPPPNRRWLRLRLKPD